ncbi:MAG: DUF7678 domain-containing protein [Natronincolaceae bacterium]|nr:hypothetical protein [Bacillota bacterium]NLK91183.1 hypothetical protein [Clostridiales bacterium]
MLFNIKVNYNTKSRYGYIKGEVDSFTWFALVHKEDVEFGINAENLETGKGRVSRLCLYKDIPMPNYTKRLIYANYRRGWDVFNKSYEKMVMDLVGYLDRIYSIRAVK